MKMKGCLYLVILAVMAFFVWAQLSVPLETLGTVTHVGRDGTVKENPAALLVMIGIACVLAVVVGGVMMSGDIGCGKTFGLLCLLALAAFLLAMCSSATGGT